MATWRWDFEALKVLGTDQQGWPMLQVDQVSYDFTGTNITTNGWKAEKEANVHFATKGYLQLRALGYERIDKPANYGYIEAPFVHQYPYFRLHLSEPQSTRLKFLQQEINTKIHSLATTQIKLPHIEPGFTGVTLATRNVMMFVLNVKDVDPGKGYYSHADATQMIAALQRFYTHITPDELSVLNIAPEVVTHLQIFAARRYEATRQAT